MKDSLQKRQYPEISDFVDLDVNIIVTAKQSHVWLKIGWLLSFGIRTVVTKQEDQYKLVAC